MPDSLPEPSGRQQRHTSCREFFSFPLRSSVFPVGRLTLCSMAGSLGLLVHRPENPSLDLIAAVAARPDHASKAAEDSGAWGSSSGFWRYG